MKIAFFPGCLVDMFYPEIGQAAVEVLEKLGCEVELPKSRCVAGSLCSIPDSPKNPSR